MNKRINVLTFSFFFLLRRTLFLSLLKSCCLNCCLNRSKLDGLIYAERPYFTIKFNYKIKPLLCEDKTVIQIASKCIFFTDSELDMLGIG